MEMAPSFAIDETVRVRMSDKDPWNKGYVVSLDPLLISEAPGGNGLPWKFVECYSENWETGDAGGFRLQFLGTSPTVGQGSPPRLALEPPGGSAGSGSRAHQQCAVEAAAAGLTGAAASTSGRLLIVVLLAIPSWCS